MAEESLACVNCRQSPPEGRDKWQCCRVCDEARLPATYYCGMYCMNAQWPEHKEWHQKMKGKERMHMESHKMETYRSIAEDKARLAERTGDAYDKRFAAAMAHMAEDDNHAAAKAWRRMIKKWPEEDSPYNNLGVVLHRSDRNGESALMSVKAMEVDDEDTKTWANAAASAFFQLNRSDCNDVPKPEWWNDEALKALSARVLAVAPDERRLNLMRVYVLRGNAVPGEKALWNAGPRTAAEIKEAATRLRRIGYTHSAKKCENVAEQLFAEEAEASDEPGDLDEQDITTTRPRD